MIADAPTYEWPPALGRDLQVELLREGDRGRHIAGRVGLDDGKRAARIEARVEQLMRLHEARLTAPDHRPVDVLLQCTPVRG